MPFAIEQSENNTIDWDMMEKFTIYCRMTAAPDSCFPCCGVINYHALNPSNISNITVVYFSRHIVCELGVNSQPTLPVHN